MTALVRYEAACRALEEAHSVDEVKDIHDRAVAMRAYAIQAKNVDLEVMAAEVRVRAERRLGEMLKAEKEAGRLRRGRRWKSNSAPDAELEAGEARITLPELGVDEHLSKRSQKLASISEQAFEAMVAGTRQQIKERSQRRPKQPVADKKQMRAERERELAAKQQALPQQRFGVILADPEWRFEPYSRETGMDRAADNHYPTSATQVICARPVQDIAADDCVLFLWATVPMLPDALAVMAAWGFEYKSHCIWRKDRVGTGYWFRNQHELLLVGTRGNVPAPAPGTQWPSVIDAPVGAHSAKPERFIELIEAYFPNLPKIELNRRGPARPGWAAWGNEAEPSISEPAGSTPLIRRGESESESNPGFSAGSLVNGSQPSGECNDQDSIGRRSEGHDNRILRNGHLPARVPERVRSPNNPAEQVEGREDDRPGDVRYRTGDAGEGGQAESGQADRRTTERTETCGYPVPIADPWAELDIPKLLRRVPESQSSSPAAPVETAADLAADGSCLTESSAAFSQESQTGAAFIAPIPVAAPAAAAGSGVGSAVVSTEGKG